MNWISGVLNLLSAVEEAKEPQILVETAVDNIGGTTFMRFDGQFKIPDPKWELVIADGLLYRPSGDRDIPNAFHRFMQRLAFGFRWKRLEPSP